MTDTADKKIQRDFYDGLVMNVADRPPASATGIPKWATFKQLFIGKMGTMVILNLLTLIFALPAMAVIVWFSIITSQFNATVPYSSNIGIGYPVVIDAAWQAQSATFTYNVVEFAMLIPCIMLLFIGLGGSLYTMRKLILGESKKPAREFFAGIKKTWWRSILMGLLVGCAVYLFVTALGIFDYFKLHIAYKAIGIIISSIILVFVLIFAMFYLSQSTGFSMKSHEIAKNSAILTIGSHAIGIFFIAVALLPILLFFWQEVVMFGICVYVLLGFSYFTLVVMLFCNDRFDKYLYDKAVTVTVYQKAEKTGKSENKDRTEPADKTSKTESRNNLQGEFAPQAEKPFKQAVKYKNPKKGKK